MNIAVDIDDTLTESFNYFQPCVADFFDVDLYVLREKKISYSNLPEEWKPRELEFCRKYYDILAAGTPFKPYAAESIEALHDDGHRIIIITGRTTEFYTDPYATTVEELRNGGIVYDRLICTLDKGKACADENIDIIIDDSPANCEAAARQGVLPLLFTSKANIGVDTPFMRVADWNEVVRTVRSIKEKK